MNLLKLKQLENKFDVCGGGKATEMVYDASTPLGKCPLFKPLMTNKCVHSCKYCINTANRYKMDFGPEELAKTFIGLYKKGRVQGLFLSSAVNGEADPTTERMLEAVRLVRFRYNFRGYIHFKILPGTGYDLIKQAAGLADRLSINIESPSKSRLSEISETKEYKSDLLKRQAWIKNLHPNQTTQLIVGATDETDLEVLKMVDWEYKNLELKRVYYSAFSPVRGTKLETKKAAPLWRANRLYNLDFLLRKYGYKMDDFKMILDENDMLINSDPKLELAKLNNEKIEVNEAEYGELIKIPGIGIKTAKNIISHKINNKNKIEKYRELKEMGVILKRALPFIKVNGRYQAKLNEF